MEAWLSAAALAGSALLSPAVPPTREVKVDVFHLQPQERSLAAVEQWSAVLACQADGGRAEVCDFPHGVWWGYVPRGGSAFHAVQLPSPGLLRFRWSAHGRLKGWSYAGDRERFWRQVSNTRLQALERPKGVYSASEQRRVGRELEEQLARGMGGALEWEVPVDVSEVGTARLSGTPWRARQWPDAAASSKLDVTWTASEGRIATLALEGTVSEQATQASQLTYAHMRGEARFDASAGQVVEAWSEIRRSTREGTPAGYGVSRHRLVRWSPGDPTEPADLPGEAEDEARGLQPSAAGRRPRPWERLKLPPADSR